MGAISRSDYRVFLGSHLPKILNDRTFQQFCKDFKRKYSQNNMALLFYQNPKITLTQGLKQRNKLWRRVKKWEKWYTIMWWGSYKKVNEKTWEEEEKISFSPRVVFDISQTVSLPSKKKNGR